MPLRSKEYKAPFPPFTDKDPTERNKRTVNRFKLTNNHFACPFSSAFTAPLTRPKQIKPNREGTIRNR